MNALWSRLRQRKLVQWAVAYAAAAWVVLQVLDMAGNNYDWPHTVMRVALGVASLGFLVTLLLAWYHGERGAQKVSGAELLILSALFAVGGFLIWRFAPSEPPTSWPVASAPAPARHAAPKDATASAGEIDHKSIAVLPFENLSEDKGNAYFADGMQDLILTKLADIGQLKVISRTSTMKYASHPDDLKTIAQQLGVATILEGSVQKAGDQVLINVQLIDAKTDSHLWAQSYTRNLTNIFGVEGEVAGKIADALKARLSPVELAAVANVPTQVPAAYDAYLRGEHYITQAKAGDMHAALPKAVAAYQQAVDSDPHFAKAWAALAYSQSALAYSHVDDSDATRQQALANAQRALVLAPDLPQAHLAMGYVYRFDFADYDKALAEFKLAQQGSPNDAQVDAAIAYIEHIQGHLQAELVHLQRAVALDPRDPNLALGLGLAWRGLHDYDRALAAYQRGLAVAPDDPEMYRYIAQLKLLAHADVDAALAVLQSAPAALQSASDIVFARVSLLLLKRDFAAARAAVRDLQPGGRSIAPIDVTLLRAQVYRLSGDAAAAHSFYTQALASAKAQQSARGGQQGETWVRLHMAEAEAALGQKTAALQTIQKLMAAGQREHSASVVAAAQFALARAYILLGDDDQAIAALNDAPSTGFVGMSGGVTDVQLRLDPFWDPIRKDPRFQALLTKYAHPQSVHGGSTTP
jgi:TolB-like protein/Flp pilus assembly protein TadD